jgi:hypothetical protein
VEQDMLEILLKGHGPLVICPARSLVGMQVAVKLRERLTTGQLLFCSVTDPREKRGRARFADERNALVAGLAADWRFVHVEEGGKVAELRRRLG